MHVIITLLIILLSPTIALADSSNLNISVQVLQKKVTDTVNDFMMPGQRTDNELNVAVSEPSGKVLGASTSEPAQSSMASRIINWLKSLFR